MFYRSIIKKKSKVYSNLCYSDGQHKPWWWTVGITVKIPLAVHLSWQSLIGNVTYKSPRQTQAHFLSQRGIPELPTPLQDRSTKTVWAFVAHLKKTNKKKKHDTNWTVMFISTFLVNMHMIMYQLPSQSVLVAPLLNQAFMCICEGLNNLWFRICDHTNSPPGFFGNIPYVIGLWVF